MLAHITSRWAPTLGRRLALGFSAVIALLLTVVALSLGIGTRVEAQVRDIVEINERRMELANALVVEVSEMAIVLRTLTLLTDLKEVDRHSAMLASAMARYLGLERQLAEHLSVHRSIAAEQKLREQIVATRTRAVDLIDKAAKLGASGETTEVATLLMRDILPVEQAWRVDLGKLIALERQLNAEAYAGVRATQDTAVVLLLGIGAFSVATAALLAWGLTRSVVKPVSEAIRFSERIAEGDLSSDVSEGGMGELGRLLLALKRMQDRLHALVGVIRVSAHTIVLASDEIAKGNADLSQRTEMQSASLQKTASSVTQLETTVKSSTVAALHADQLASSASGTAQRGGRIVEGVIAKMTEIAESSERIERITAVIDTIAFRTNLLALNAGVEAARAGEEGRGFAVVANEVRALARQSAEAAREIKTLIHASVECVSAGRELVAQAGTTMNDIVGSTQRVTEFISGITVSAADQGKGIAQVSREMGQLDSMTQQNAALAEQSTAATESLLTQAQALAQSVDLFKLRASESS